MTSRRSHRKPDLFSWLLILVTLGMALTLAYQVDLHYGGRDLPIARQAPAGGGAEVVDG